MQVFCRFFAGNLQEICRKFAGFLQVFCRFFAGFLQVFCRFFAGFLQVFCRFFHRFLINYLQVLCRNKTCFQNRFFTGFSVPEVAYTQHTNGVTQCSTLQPPLPAPHTATSYAVTHRRQLAPGTGRGQGRGAPWTCNRPYR